LSLLERFAKNAQIKFRKNSPVGAEFFHVERRTDGRTDMTKLIVTFQNFVKALKNKNPIRISSIILQSKTDEALLLFTGLNFVPPPRILMQRETAPARYERLHKRTTVILLLL
jgi:hypothetical protein